MSTRLLPLTCLLLACDTAAAGRAVLSQLYRDSSDIDFGADNALLAAPSGVAMVPS